MIKNYFKIAWRAFVKDKTYATINLIGLAIALACVLMIAAYVNYELSFDKSYSHSDRIYRVVVERKRDSLAERTFSMPDAVAYTLKSEFPEIEAVTKISKRNRDFDVNSSIVNVETIDVDSSFFHLFNLPFISGSPSASLKNNGNIVLTERTAKKLFPHQIAIGKILKYKDYNNKQKAYLVTGIIKNIPPNTHFQAEAIVADTRVQEPLDWHAYNNSGTKYILLKNGTNIKSLRNKLKPFYKKYGFSKTRNLIFQPVTAIHLHSHVENEPFENSDIKYVYIFSFIALLILFIACINYINLTTVRSLQRVKEVGMRKVLGAGKSQLAFQFITESVILFLSALPIAFVIAWLLWPSFSSIVDIKAENLVLFRWQFLLAAILIGLLAGILSGAYPAFFLSRLKPVAILQDWKRGFNINLSIRKALIVFQFVITIGLIVATIIVHKQLYLLNNMELGFNKNYLITLPSQGFSGKTASFKHELKEGRNIKDVSFSSWDLKRSYYGSTSSMSQTGDSLKEWNFGFVGLDVDFLNTMQIKLLAGRDFSKTDLTVNDVFASRETSDSTGTADEFKNTIYLVPIIITKTTAQNLGLKPPIVGQVLKLGALQGTVIGEINDFKGISLLEKNPMVVLRLSKNMSFGNTYIRINSKNIPQTIDFIKGKWKQFFPGKNFSFQFMDDQIASLYKKQQRLATLFSAFATLAILISLLGLFSLVALIARQRTKEIGIRKVLGAGVTEIVGLLSGSFVKLILIAFAIATPLVWWAMKSWLQDFQYRIKISWWIFLIAGAGSLIFALMVVAVQAIKAAVANPVDSLRTE